MFARKDWGKLGFPAGGRPRGPVWLRDGIIFRPQDFFGCRMAPVKD
jgi:hypothetical protein